MVRSGSTISRLLIQHGYHCKPSSFLASVRPRTYQPSVAYALTILLASYIMDGIGLLLAAMIMAIYFQRLAVHHLPARDVIISTFLPLGPCGQGGYALIELVRTSYLEF